MTSSEMKVVRCEENKRKSTSRIGRDLASVGRRDVKIKNMKIGDVKIRDVKIIK